MKKKTNGKYINNFGVNINISKLTCKATCSRGLKGN